MHPRLVGAVSLYTGNRDVAHEIAQECLARVCRDWRKVKRLDNREGWALGVAMNLANSHYRRRAAERRAKERIGARNHATAEPRDWAQGITLRDALSSLLPRQRAVVIMRFYADMPFAQIAHTLDISESTVKSLARRGIDRLRKDIAELAELRGD